MGNKKFRNWKNKGEHVKNSILFWKKNSMKLKRQNTFLQFQNELDRLVANGMLNQKMSAFLSFCVKNHKQDSIDVVFDKLIEDDNLWPELSKHLDITDKDIYKKGIKEGRDEILKLIKKK